MAKPQLNAEGHRFPDVKSRVLLIVLLGIVYVAVGYSVREFRADSPRWLDPDGIGEIGRNLCSSGEFAIVPGEPTVLRGPAYPAALALPCRLTGIDALSFVPLLNGLCHAATLLLLAFHPLTGRGNSRIAALVVVAIDPLLLNYAGRTYLEPMFILSIALVVAAVDRSIERPGLQTTVLLGVSLGFSLLVKPTLLLFPALLAPYLLSRSRRTCLVSLGAIGIAALMVVPWTYRNAKLTGQMIPVSTGGWQIILKGDTFVRKELRFKGIEAREAAARSELELLDKRLDLSGLPLHEKEPAYRRVVAQRMKEKPLEQLKKLLVQGVDYWILGGDVQRTLVFALLQLPAMALGLVAIGRRAARGCEGVAGIALMTCYLWGIHAASLAIARYSMPLRPWLLVGAVGLIAGRLQGRQLGGGGKATTRERRKRAVTLAAGDRRL